jgi:hypothetical protein
MDDPRTLQQLALDRISEIKHVACEQAQGRAAIRRNGPRSLLLAWRHSVGQALVIAGMRLIGPDARS